MSNEDVIEGMSTGGNYSESQYETWKFPAADGSVIIRPFPPMKSMQKRRGLGLYYKTHYGWSGRDPRDPSKLRARPFLCLEEKDSNGKIVVVCPACALRKDRQAKIDGIKALGLERGKTPEQIKKACEPHNEWLYNHGCDGKARIPGMNKKGQIGIFMAPWNAYKSFQDKLKELQQKGKEGAGFPKGLFFEFIRSGKASKDSDRCEIAKVEVEVNGETLEKNDEHILTRDVAQQAMESIPDLQELRDKIRYPLEKLVELCKLTADAEGAYDPDEVDRILGSRPGAKEAPKAAAKEAEGEGDDWTGDDVISSPKAATGSKASTTTTAASTPAVASTKTTKAQPAPAPVEDEEFGGDEPEEAPKPKTVAKPVAAKAAAPVAAKSETIDDIFGS